MSRWSQYSCQASPSFSASLSLVLAFISVLEYRKCCVQSTIRDSSLDCTWLSIRSQRDWDCHLRCTSIYFKNCYRVGYHLVKSVISILEISFYSAEFISNVSFQRIFEILEVCSDFSLALQGHLPVPYLFLQWWPTVGYRKHWYGIIWQQWCGTISSQVMKLQKK